METRTYNHQMIAYILLIVYNFIDWLEMGVSCVCKYFQYTKWQKCVFLV